MSAPIRDDGNNSEQSRYAPPRFREQPPMPACHAALRPFGINSSFVDRRRSGPADKV